MHLEIDGGGGQLHPDAGAGDGQAVSDADRGHFYDYGAGDGGDGAGGAGGAGGWRCVGSYWTGGRRGTTWGVCCGASIKRKWSGGKFSPSRGPSRPTRNAKPKSMFSRRRRGGGTRRFSTGTGPNFIYGRRT